MGTERRKGQFTGYGETFHYSRCEWDRGDSNTNYEKSVRCSLIASLDDRRPLKKCVSAIVPSVKHELSAHKPRYTERHVIIICKQEVEEYRARHSVLRKERENLEIDILAEEILISGMIDKLVQKKTETEDIVYQIFCTKQRILEKVEVCKSQRKYSETLEKMQQDLREEIEDLEHELRHMKTRKSGIERNIENSRLQLENTELKEEVNRLRLENKKLNSELQSTVQQLLNKNKKLTEDLTQARKTGRNNIFNENPRLEDYNEKLLKENERLLRKLSSEEEMHEKEIAKLKKNEKESGKIMESYETLHVREENTILKKEIEQLHRTNESLYIDLKHARESAIIKEDECIRTRKELEQTTAENANLISADEMKKYQHLQEKEQLLHDQKKLKEDLRNEQDSVKKEITEKYTLQEKNQDLQKQITQMNNKILNLSDKLRHEENCFKLKEEECKTLQLMIKAQKEQNVGIQAANDREKQLVDSKVELQNKIQRLSQEKNNLTEELRHERETRQKLNKYSNSNLQEIYQKDVNQLRYQNQQLHENLEREKDDLKKMEYEYNKNSLAMQEQMTKQQQEIVRLTAKLAESSDRNSKIDSRLKKNMESDKDLQQHLNETRDQLKRVQRELDDTKSRLSRAMGDKLTDNNPNIADLSDKNRPTKISERYQELYDNQWTDAFEIVNATLKNEENTINVLRVILMDTLEYCKTKAADQMFQIKASFLKGEELPANMVKQVKDCRKAMAEQYGKGLYQDYHEQLRTSKSSLAISTPTYAKECFEICWLMVVQDPPVVFGPDIRRGDTFNKDHYKAYTRSGERVDFVVWPVLFLHQNGPVLCKGVAQGK